MRLLVLVLNKTEYLEEVLEAFLELGVSGATLIESVGMGRFLSSEIPIFTGLRDVFSGASPQNKTILAVLEPEKVEIVVDAVEDICGSFEEKGTGILFTVPLDFIKGYKAGF